MKCLSSIFSLWIIIYLMKITYFVWYLRMIFLKKVECDANLSINLIIPEFTYRLLYLHSEWFLFYIQAFVILINVLLKISECHFYFWSQILLQKKRFQISYFKFFLRRVWKKIVIFFRRKPNGCDVTKVFLLKWHRLIQIICHKFPRGVETHKKIYILILLMLLQHIKYNFFYIIFIMNYNHHPFTYMN